MLLPRPARHKATDTRCCGAAPGRRRQIDVLADFDDLPVRPDYRSTGNLRPHCRITSVTPATCAGFSCRIAIGYADYQLFNSVLYDAWALVTPELGASVLNTSHTRGSREFPADSVLFSHPDLARKLVAGCRLVQESLEVFRYRCVRTPRSRKPALDQLRGSYMVRCWFLMCAAYSVSQGCSPPWQSWDVLFRRRPLRRN